MAKSTAMLKSQSRSIRLFCKIWASTSLSIATTLAYMASSILVSPAVWYSKGEAHIIGIYPLQMHFTRCRVWWITVFSLSLYLCIDLILVTYRKWDTSPVIVSFAQSPTPVWGIPFPAVTICSETKSRQTKFNFTEAYHQMRAENISEEV